MKILIAQMNSIVGDFEGNFLKMKKILDSAKEADLVVFPECALCGYPPQDLLDYPIFGQKCEEYNQRLVKESKDKSFIFGSIEKNKGKGKPLYNIAIFCEKGKVLGKYHKRLLPTYDVFDEDRFFEPGKEPCIVDFKNEKIGLTICEDIWSESVGTHLQNRYHANPLEESTAASFFINLSASPFEYKKVLAKQKMLEGIAKRYGKPFIYVNSIGANDSLIFNGRSSVWRADGSMVNGLQRP